MNNNFSQIVTVEPCSDACVLTDCQNGHLVVFNLNGLVWM